jgi:WD40 repeat protein
VSAIPESPYKGLNAFEDSELDALLFFGRERETEIVVANLIASRLTVLYGPSGVGKSSLLRAAVARSLRALPEEPLVVVFSRWGDDPAAALAEAVADAAGVASDGSPLELLERSQAGRDVYLVLDQAEEYFLYHADDAGPGSFAEALPAVVTAPWRVNVLVSVREDSLAKLDRFTGRIPAIFANTLRLDRLDRRAARAAIVRPVERFAELTQQDAEVEPGLVERVLDEVGAGQIEPALGGLGSVESTQDGARIEAPYLQLVMQRVWEEERDAGSPLLRVQTLERLGGAQHVVEEHLEGAMAALTMDQKDVAARLFNHLVTPSGTKIAHGASDLADFGGVSVAELDPMLDALGDRRILRSLEEGEGKRYEIFHDVLAQPVLAWRTEHEADRELNRQKEDSDRRHRRLLGVIAAGSVLLAAMAAVTVYALSQRTEAREQAREAEASALEAKAHELEALARSAFDDDPELGLLLTREAALLAPSQTSEETLREALRVSRLRSIVRLGASARGASVRRGAVIAATDGGSLVTADGRSGRASGRIETGADVRAVSFAADGSALLTDARGRLVLVGPGGSTSRVPLVTRARGSQLSSDGKVAVVFDELGARLVEVDSGRVRQTYDRLGTLAAALSENRRLVGTGHAAKAVRVWDAATAGRLQKLFGHVGGISAVDFSPSGTLVASASTDGTARVWRVSDGQFVAVLTGHGNSLTDVEFSPDGTQLVTASEDRTARVWKVDTGALLAVLRGHSEVVTSAVFTGTGRSVVTASADGTARVWDTEVQPELDVLATLPAPVLEVAPGKGVLRVVAGDGRVHLLDRATGRERRSEDAPRRRGFVVGPGGRRAIIKGTSVHVVGGVEGRIVLEGHTDRVTSAAFAPDGARLVTASRDRDARVWDLSTSASLVLQGHFGPVRDARFSPDGRWVVTAGPGRAGLWDTRNGELVALLRGHKGALMSAAFDRTGRTIVTGGVDGTVRTYRCDLCGGLDELIRLAERRLDVTGRELTTEERERYLGP